MSLLPELPCFDRDNTDGRLVVHQSTKAGEVARHIRDARQVRYYACRSSAIAPAMRSASGSTASSNTG